MEHTIAALYFSSIALKVNGKRNNKPPATLFMTECTVASLLFWISPNTILAALIRVMTVIPIPTARPDMEYTAPVSQAIPLRTGNRQTYLMWPRMDCCCWFFLQPCHRAYRSIRISDTPHRTKPRARARTPAEYCRKYELLSRRLQYVFLFSRSHKHRTALFYHAVIHLSKNCICFSV